MIGAGPLLGLAAAVPAGPPHDTVLDCTVREVKDARLPRAAWSPASGETSRVVLFLAGRGSPVLRRGEAGIRYHASYDTFTTGGAVRSFVDWPNRVELGTSSETGRASQRIDALQVSKIGLRRDRAEIAITHSEWPFGGRDSDTIVTGGHFGECRITQGTAVLRRFEDME